jgi:hypothetical protein
MVREGKADSPLLNMWEIIIKKRGSQINLLVSKIINT